MERCFRCEKTEKEVRLFDAIHRNETVKSCEKCAIIEGIPLLKKPSTRQLKEAERANSVYTRLKRLAGLEKRDEKVESFMERLERVDETPEIEQEDRPLNLIENFNWHIQRARRNKGISPKQLGWALGESESAIKMIEKAEIPEDAEKLIRKLEQFFQIKLRERTEKEKQEERKKIEILKEKSRIPDIEQEKEPIMPIISEPEISEEDIISTIEDADIEERELNEDSEEKQPSQVLTFKSEQMQDLTIADLKKLKEEQEREDNLAEVEKRRKDSLIESQAQRLIQEADEEEQRSQIAKRKVAEEMKNQVLGQKEESIKDKKDILNKKLREISEKKRIEKGIDKRKKIPFTNGKVPSISELIDKKKKDTPKKEGWEKGKDNLDIKEDSGIEEKDKRLSKEDYSSYYD
jgi:ribosome-binding protein aMBF1 (putative translation factor)